VPLYRAFGGWRQVLAEPQKPNRIRRLAPGRRPLAVHEGTTAPQARLADEKLREAAKALWPKVLAMGPSGRRGRPPYRQRLQELLAGQGLQVTRRQLGRLMAELKR
jgi:hypothetical protein